MPERLVGEALSLGAPSGPSDAAQPRLSDAHLTPRMVQLMARPWPVCSPAMCPFHPPD